MDNNLLEEKINDLIYEVRGKQVMLDSDLARLYGCKNGTREINQGVKRNLDKFPERYYFQLTKDEFLNLKSQIVTSSFDAYGGIRKLPYVFTEQGIYMLATILKTKTASLVTMKIIDTFVYFRKYISYDENKILLNYEERIIKLEEAFEKFNSKQKSIVYEDKIYDAYSLLIDIFNDADKEIIITDNYIDKNILDLLRTIDKKIIIFSKSVDETLSNIYSKQYNNITFKNYSPFHDRYIILDRKNVYISGMSLKDLGKKYSYIYKMNEEIFITELISRLKCML